MYKAPTILPSSNSTFNQGLTDAMIRLLLTGLIDRGTSPDGDTSWATFQFNGAESVIFWGNPDEGHVNINMLAHQNFPLLIDLEDPELCQPEPHVKSRYGCTYSVNEACYVTVHPIAENV